MKVKQLIKELKQVSQNLDVQIIMPDNYEYEAADICTVHLFNKATYDPECLTTADKELLDTMPDKCVILRC